MRVPSLVMTLLGGEPRRERFGPTGRPVMLMGEEEEEEAEEEEERGRP